ncbi:RNA helicase [Mycena indigotica]|uniref:RNA helicase n=1 Tax=Mycena indigotica TaxID=2126181 RepID=A0A8H6S3C3_9AGAR|nr:RNA helicase [Mycena indigotica]KAF7291981.1 RNA helicase [Mycena indigotica]
MSIFLQPNPTYCYQSVDGGCQRGAEHCPLRHDLQRCSCGRVLLLDVDMQAHLAGRRHREDLRELRMRRQEHQRVPEALVNEEEEATPCDRCGAMLAQYEQKRHLQMHLRTRRRLFADANAMDLEAEADKHTISVSHRDGIDFGVVGLEDSLPVDITVLKAGMDRIVLETLAMRNLASKFSATLAGKSRWVTHIRARTLCIRFVPEIEGEFKDVLELVFLNVTTRERFLITRKVTATVGSKEDHELLKPTSEYVRRPRPTPIPFKGKVIQSIRPPTWGPNAWKSKLLPYEPPADLINVAFGSPHGRDVARGVKRLNLELYAMTDVELKPNHPRYDLQVKGLEEGRPSVVIGDFIRVKHTGSEDGPWYEGRVHQVHQNHVSLRFGDEFSTYRGNKFDVRFTLNRLPLRRMHQALTNKSNPQRLLFPDARAPSLNRRSSTAEMDQILPVNRLVAEDKEQLETVAAILHRPKGECSLRGFWAVCQMVSSTLFLVANARSRPGTGKTVTIVEAIKQIVLKDPNARVLACAPSNSAADLMAQRLASTTESLLRLNSLTRKHGDLPKDLQKYSLINGNLTFVLPILEDLEKYRVVVSTCLSGGVPAQLGIKRGYYSHIFVDEAGQATEPEVMLPIKSLADVNTNIVLAGDIKQLGPIVQSSLAASLGLSKSYLVRLMQRDIYSLEADAPVGGRGINIVKLVNNFRSHPAILNFSNNQFYDGELVSCGNPALIKSLENSDELPRKKFPLIFHGIAGKDQREGFSPSFFNIDEATIVKKYVGSLLSNKKLRLRAEDIGIITPYHAQRCKINLLLSKEPKFKGITVGSVEEFQGQACFSDANGERRVIIMSTVRSNTNYVESDIRKSLGFVASPQRFNVAITRAQALLIVVGNPDVLSLDPLWREFMNYVHSGGGWRGKTISWDPEVPVSQSTPDVYDRAMKRKAEGDAEETMARLKALILRRNDDSDLELDLSDDEPEWGTGIEQPIRWDAE